MGRDRPWFLYHLLDQTAWNGNMGPKRRKCQSRRRSRLTITNFKDISAILGVMVDLSHNAFLRALNFKKERPEEEIAAEREAIDRRLEAIAKGKPASAKPIRRPEDYVPRKPRKKVFRAAELFITSCDALPCTVTNLSADGAGITLQEDHELPVFVTLKFTHSRVTRKARVVWQHGADLGVAFIRPKPEEAEDEGADADLDLED